MCVLRSFKLINSWQRWRRDNCLFLALFLCSQYVPNKAFWLHFLLSPCIFRALIYCLCLNLDELQVFRLLLYLNSFFLFAYFLLWTNFFRTNFGKRSGDSTLKLGQSDPLWIFSLDGLQRFVNAAEGVGQSEKAAIFNVSLTSPSRVGTDHLCHFNKAANRRENSFLVFRVWKSTIAIPVQMPLCCFEELW